MKTIKAFQCEHCLKKIYLHKKSAKHHEARCYWNIANKACASCGNQVSHSCIIKNIDLDQRSNLKIHCDSWSDCIPENFFFLGARI
jgi:hypothetical protein